MNSQVSANRVYCLHDHETWIVVAVELGPAVNLDELFSVGSNYKLMLRTILAPDRTYLPIDNIPESKTHVYKTGHRGIIRKVLAWRGGGNGDAQTETVT